MASVSQLPAPLNYNGVAGNPLSIVVNFTITNANGASVPWASITAYQVDIADQFGNAVTDVTPTITSPSAYTLNIGWTAQQTLTISEAQTPRMALSVYVTGVGPYAVMSGLLTLSPPEYPATS
jgi:hypothetical protein